MPTECRCECQLNAIVNAVYNNALPVWRKYLNSADIDGLQPLFVQANRWQVVSDNYEGPELFDNCYLALLKLSLNVTYGLRHLYPDKKF